MASPVIQTTGSGARAMRRGIDGTARPGSVPSMREVWRDDWRQLRAWGGEVPDGHPFLRNATGDAALECWRARGYGEPLAMVGTFVWRGEVPHVVVVNAARVPRLALLTLRAAEERIEREAAECPARGGALLCEFTERDPVCGTQLCAFCGDAEPIR